MARTWWKALILSDLRSYMKLDEWILSRFILTNISEENATYFNHCVDWGFQVSAAIPTTDDELEEEFQWTLFKTNLLLSHTNTYDFRGAGYRSWVRARRDLDVGDWLFMRWQHEGEGQDHLHVHRLGATLAAGPPPLVADFLVPRRPRTFSASNASWASKPKMPDNTLPIKKRRLGSQRACECYRHSGYSDLGRPFADVVDTFSKGSKRFLVLSGIPEGKVKSLHSDRAPCYREEWTLMKNISVTEHLQYESGKFSKSKGIGVFGNDVKDTNIPLEVWRYYLLSNRPEAQDTEFSWDDLQAKLNSELLSNLGNYVNRVLSFIAKPPGQGFGSTIPDAPEAKSHSLTVKLAETVAKHVKDYVEAMEKIGKPKPLFQELKDDEKESYRNRFAGSQADRAVKAAVEQAGEQLRNTAISEGSQKKKATKSASGAGSKSKSNTEAEITISRLDIRVGLITIVQKHPDADSLYVEEIDAGEPTPRIVVSGLVNHIPIEEMENRKVSVLCNLKPTTMRGIKSHAMVLAASDSEHTKVELVDPPKDDVVRERVKFPGFEGEPD